jgi:class 3 adenylate cyclase/YHS domain-containing protein
MADSLSLDELSARTGVAPDELRAWQAAGLLGASEGEHFAFEAAGRAKIVALLLRRGLDLEAVVRAEARQSFLAHEAGSTFGDKFAAALTVEEAAGQIGVDAMLLERIVSAGNLGYEGGWLDRDDIDALRGMKAVLDAGFPEEALLQVTRVFADTMARAAEGAQRAFHIYVHERMRTAGMSPTETAAAAASVAETASGIAEPTVIYFFRKANARAMLEDTVVHAAELAGLTDVPVVPGEVERAVMFVDLSSFTPLTEAMGDHVAADVLDRFSLLVRDTVQRHDGRIVKQNGDAFMLVFPAAADAVAAALEVEERTVQEPQFPAARSGVHWGKVIFREGDYVGASVNVAARVQAEAQRHQVLVTAAARSEAKRLGDADFVRLGARRLRGVSEEMELFEARRAGAGQALKTIDPVCGMELGAEEVAARLTVDGAERSFCSDGCLRLFVAAPERYAAATK